MGSSTMSILILVLLLGAMYFFMIRPQRKREKETNAMRAGIGVGDEIITIGGICAKVVKTKDETIIVQVGADKVKMEMMRWSVSKVVKEGSGRHDRSAEDYDEFVEAEKKEARKSKPKRMKKAMPAAEKAPVEDAAEEAAEAVEEAPATVEEAVEDVVEETK